MSNPAESAAKKIAWELGSWKAIEFRISEDFENTDPQRMPSQPRTFHATYRYIETAADQRMYEYRLNPDNDPGTGIGIEYTDGSRCAQLLRNDTNDQPGQEQVAIKRYFGQENGGYTHRPEPLKSLYVGLKPLPEVLAGASSIGEERRLGRDCDRFLFSRVQGEKDPGLHVYWLDRETGLTLRSEFYRNQQDWSREAPNSVWNAESVDTVEGHHLVLKSEILTYNPDGPNPGRPVMRHHDVVDEVSFDRAYPATTFWPAITDQTRVLDYVANKVVSPKKPVQKTATTATPIQAVDPGGWSVSYSSAALLLGAIALGVGFFLHRRRG